MRSNPPINRNCNSPLRWLPQSGYWQRYAADKLSTAATRFKINSLLHNAKEVEIQNDKKQIANGNTNEDSEQQYKRPALAGCLINKTKRGSNIHLVSLPSPPLEAASNTARLPANCITSAAAKIDISFGLCVVVKLRHNPPINRTCLRQAGYWQR